MQNSEDTNNLNPAIVNVMQNLPEDLSEERFEDILQLPGIRIERITSRSHCSAPDFWYDQPQHEWVLVLQGEGHVDFPNGDSKQLKVGDHLYIPAHQQHRVSWTTPEEATIWIAVHID